MIETALPSARIRLLMVEDDERLAQLTGRYLEQYGLKITLVHDGESALHIAFSQSFNIVLLDLMLPGKDGMQVCQELRAKLDIPIIMLTARSDEVDRVLGLEAGADDYVAKPFSSRELLARIRAQVRRASGRAGPSQSKLRAGCIELDPARLLATVNGKPLELTSFEFSLLRVFVERANRVLTRE